MEGGTGRHSHAPQAHSLPQPFAGAVEEASFGLEQIIMKRKRQSLLQIRLEPELEAAIRAKAAKEERTLTATVRRAIIMYLGFDKPEK